MQRKVNLRTLETGVMSRRRSVVIYFKNKRIYYIEQYLIKFLLMQLSRGGLYPDVHAPGGRNSGLMPAMIPAVYHYTLMIVPAILAFVQKHRESRIRRRSWNLTPAFSS